MGAREDIAFLVGSASRVNILQALEQNPSRPTRVARECSCARETAQRTLSGFVERGWVEKSDATYRLTPGGTAVLEQYTEFTDIVDGTSQLKTFLTNVGTLAEAFPTDEYEEMTLTEASSTDPHAPIDRYLTILGAEPVGSFEGMTPVVSRVYNEAAASVIGPETEMELIIDDSVLATSESAYSESLQRADDLDQFRLYVTPREVDVGVAIVDGHAYAGAYDDQNTLVASVDGDCEELLAWVRAVYHEYRQSATLFEQQIA